MQVLLIIGSVQGGGAERQMGLLAQGLREAGDDVEIATLSASSRVVELDGIRVHSLRGANQSWFRCLLHLRRIARSVDVLYSFMDAANTAAGIACWGLPVRLVWGVRSAGVAGGAVARWSFRLSCWLSRRADLAIANSGAVKDFYDQSGLAPKRWAVVANGVDTSMFHVQPKNPAAQDLPRHTWRAGMIARADPLKRHDLLVQVIAELKERLPGLRWVIAGTDTDRTDGMVSRLVEDYKIADVVELRGHVEDVAELLAHLDVTVCLSDIEGSSNAMLESIACGVPVLSFDVGDARVLLDDAGVIVKPAIARAMAAAVEQLLGDPDRLTALGKSGSDQALQTYGAKGMIEQTRALLSPSASAPGSKRENH